MWTDEPSEVYCMDEPQLTYLREMEDRTEVPTPEMAPS